MKYQWWGVTGVTGLGMEFKHIGGGSTPYDLLKQIYPCNQKWEGCQDRSKYGQDCTPSYGWLASINSLPEWMKPLGISVDKRDKTASKVGPD